MVAEFGITPPYMKLANKKVTSDMRTLFCGIFKKTGVPLNVSIRLQLNLYMKMVSGISETEKISEVVMPIIWFEESGYIDGPVLTTFYTNLVVLPAVMEYMQYAFIGLGLATVIVAMLVHHRLKVNKEAPTAERKRSASLSEKAPLLQGDMD